MRIPGMGTTSSSFKSILASGDEEALREILKQKATSTTDTDRPLNKKGDSALGFCLRLGHYNLVALLLEAGCEINGVNKENDTPLDIVLRKVVPDDETILHEHFCPYADSCGTSFTLPAIVHKLLADGAHARSIQRLVLHVMKDEAVIGQLCHVIPNLDQSEQFRVAGLLLQTVVWFYQPDNLQVLLERGVDAETFWNAPFVPSIQPNVDTKPVVHHPDSDSGEYVCPPLPTNTNDTTHIQNLKFLFIQDWQAEWRDGENPAAQYRAGLHITPWSALTFIKAANSYAILSHVMSDVMSYLPPLCGGPNLRRHQLVEYLALAGYVLTKEELNHLQLTFQMDLASYTAYAGQPKPLKHLSRVAVRFSLRSNAVHAMQGLQMLPSFIRRYLTLDGPYGLLN